MSEKVRSIVTIEGKYLCLPDMKRALTPTFVQEHLLPVMKVGHDRKDSAEKTLAVLVGTALMEWSGELADFRKAQSEGKPIAKPFPHALTQAQLNQATCNCGQPGCQDGIVFFHSQCHPSAPAWISYRKDGLLIINCAACNNRIALIAVAK